MAWLDLLSADRELKRAALHDAQELRARFGPQAEQWCEAGLKTTDNPRKRRELKSIRAALHRVPS
jgi:hypothetical protein